MQRCGKEGGKRWACAAGLGEQTVRRLEKKRLEGQGRTQNTESSREASTRVSLASRQWRRQRQGIRPGDGKRDRAT